MSDAVSGPRPGPRTTDLDSRTPQARPHDSSCHALALSLIARYGQFCLGNESYTSRVESKREQGMRRVLSAVLASTAIVVACGGDPTPLGPEPATQLAFSVQPTNTAVNQAISPAVRVAVRDASGALVTTATDAVTLSIGTNPGTGTLSGTLTVNAVAGVATFSGLSIDEAGIGYTLTAASGSLTSATSAAFDVAAGPVQPGFAYVTNQNSNDVSVIDISTNTVTATVAVGTGPMGVAIAPDGAFAYVTNNTSNNVSVILLASNTVTATVAVGTNPVFVAITP